MTMRNNSCSNCEEHVISVTNLFCGKTFDYDCVGKTTETAIPFVWCIYKCCYGCVVFFSLVPGLEKTCANEFSSYHLKPRIRHRQLDVVVIVICIFSSLNVAFSHITSICMKLMSMNDPIPLEIGVCVCVFFWATFVWFVLAMCIYKSVFVFIYRLFVAFIWIERSGVLLHTVIVCGYCLMHDHKMYLFMS